MNCQAMPSWQFVRQSKATNGQTNIIIITKKTLHKRDQQANEREGVSQGKGGRGRRGLRTHPLANWCCNPLSVCRAGQSQEVSDTSYKADDKSSSQGRGRVYRGRGGEGGSVEPTNVVVRLLFSNWVCAVCIALICAWHRPFVPFYVIISALPTPPPPLPYPSSLLHTSVGS